MLLWPVLLWPKPKARQQKQHHQIKHYSDRNINLQFATRTFANTTAAATITMTTLLHVFIINALLLITTVRGSTVTQQHPISGNYEGVNTVDVVSALTGLSNGYATPSFMKNYYHVSEAEVTTVEQQQQQQQQQQQHQQQQSNTVVRSQYEGGVGATDIIGRGFMGLQSNNYGNSIVARGAAIAGGVAGKGALQEDAFNVYGGGFVPTTFTPAGHHYATSLEGTQSAKDKNNILHQYAATTAANKNNLHANHPAYDNGISNSNVNNNHNNYNIITETDKKAQVQQSLFRRLSNYGGLENFGGVTGTGSGSGDTTGADEIGSDGSDDKTLAGTGGASVGVMQNYALAYADDAQQSEMLQNFYNQQHTFNDAHSEQEKTFDNYFSQSMAATAGYEVESPQKYYTLNNYQQTAKPQQQQQYEQQSYLQQYRIQPYEQKQKVTPAPATYFQTFIQHKNDNNNRERHHQHRHIAGDNYHTWKQNQIMANNQPKQSTIEKQQQQQQNQHQHQQKQYLQSPSNNHYNQQHLIQEPETAETSHSTRIKKSPKHKSKRHDAQEHGYSYDTYEHNDIETETQDLSAIQLEQLQQLQHQLHQQQQQFIELQHQLIDHDQQLQIQKQIAHIPQPTLPPITHTVHHNPHSLQALAGAPLTKHTQIIKTIPIPQRHQVHVPYRENVTIEVPDPIITAISKPMAIEIPVTKTVTVPKIQEVKIPIEKLKPVPVERPIPYIVEKRVPYAVEKQVAKPVYYPVPIKVPIVHTVVHKVHPSYGHQHHQQQQSYGHGNYHQPYLHSHHHHHQQSGIHLPHILYRSTSHGSGHKRGHGHSHHYLK